MRDFIAHHTLALVLALCGGAVELAILLKEVIV